MAMRLIPLFICLNWEERNVCADFVCVCVCVCVYTYE